MKQCRTDAGDDPQGLLQINGGGGAGADQQHLGVGHLLQEADQPVDPGILTPPFVIPPFAIDDFRCQSLLDGRSGGRLLQSGGVVFLYLQGVGLEFPLGKAADAGPGVAEQHPAGAMPVQQHLDQRLAGLLAVLRFASGIVQQQQQGFTVGFTEHFEQAPGGLLG